MCACRHHKGVWARQDYGRIRTAHHSHGYYCTRMCMHCLLWRHLVKIYAGQHNSTCAQEVRQWHALATSMPPGECELLYGRTGYLYCLLYLCKHVSPKAADASMVRTTPMRSAF